MSSLRAKSVRKMFYRFNRFNLGVLCLGVGLFALAGCEDGRQDERGATSATAASRPQRLPDRLEIGRSAPRARVVELDIDANPKGIGLPAGRGSYAEGAQIYAKQCAMCHGSKGEGAGPYPQLVGAEPRSGFPFGKDPKIVKTIGNYWPYATTLFDYIRRAMPYQAPGSLSNDQVYALVAYLLAENDVISNDLVMDAGSLPKVKMPARDHFVPDNRIQSAEFR